MQAMAGACSAVGVMHLITGAHSWPFAHVSCGERSKWGRGVRGHDGMQGLGSVSMDRRKNENACAIPRTFNVLCSFRYCDTFVVERITLDLLDCVLKFDNVVHGLRPTSTSMISEFRHSSRSTDDKTGCNASAQQSCECVMWCLVACIYLYPSCLRVKSGSESNPLRIPASPHAQATKGFRKMEGGSRSH